MKSADIISKEERQEYTSLTARLKLKCMDIMEKLRELTGLDVYVFSDTRSYDIYAIFFDDHDTEIGTIPFCYLLPAIYEGILTVEWIKENNHATEID